MIAMAELGHGYDDTGSVSFVRSIAPYFEMGVIREDAAGGRRHVRCDITNISSFQKEEFGS